MKTLKQSVNKKEIFEYANGRYPKGVQVIPINIEDFRKEERTEPFIIDGSNYFIAEYHNENCIWASAGKYNVVLESPTKFCTIISDSDGK